ncbi:MAG: hypothetical protein OIF58_05145 [Cohaesibacter sp.]|nr:hypothetical protein [Cohaesibacter sp.]
MKNNLRRLPHWAGTYMVLAACIFLILISILNAAKIDPVEIAAKMVKQFRPIEPVTQKADEVRNYVLFTTVSYKQFSIDTGTRFTSSASPEIESEWCHLKAVQSTSQSHRTLTLALIDGNGKRTISNFSNAILSEFGLNKTEVRQIIKTHCRFQTQ